MQNIINAKDLKKGDVVLLPMQRSATIKEEPKVGRIFVNVVTEHGKTRYEKYDLLEIADRV